MDIDIPIEGAGVYAVHVGEKDLEATTLVIRSDIEAIVKTSRREVLVFVQDMLKGKIVPNARVFVSDGSQVILEGVTGEDGVYRASFAAHQSPLSIHQVSAFVIKDGNVASDLLNLSGLGLSKRLTPCGYIYTDRSAYRPGQSVAIRGIIRDVADGSYVVPDSAPYQISVIDGGGRLMHEEEVVLSVFGTFEAEMRLDENASVGEYLIHAASVSQSASDESQLKTPPRHTFAGHFFVQRFQLEKVQLTLDFPRGVYFRGEKIDGTFIASYYYGQPVKGARIRYTLPNGQSYTESADDQGKLPITFDTALVKPGEWLHFKAAVEGENVGVEATVFLAHLGFSIAVKPSAEVILSGEPFDVSIKTSGADGKPVGRSLKLSVFRTGRRPAHPILSQVPWLDMDDSADAEVLAEEHQVETDESSGEGKILLTLTKGGQYTLRATGTDRFGQPVLGAGKATISDDNDAIRLRIFADGTTTQVGASETVRIHSRLEDTASGPLTLALVTYEGEGIIDYKVLSLKSEMNAVQFRVGHKHFPNFYFAVAAIDGGKLRTAGKHFTVERQLNLAVSWQHKTPLPDSGGQPNYNFHPFPIYSPGKEAEVQVRATDQLGQPVKAEFSLALVDEALFAQYPETLTPINDFFQEGIRREAAMRTASSCTFRYAPATRRIVKEVLAEEQRLRDIGLGKASPKPKVRRPIVKQVIKPSSPMQDIFIFEEAKTYPRITTAVGVRTTQSFEALKRRTLGELVENITLGVPEATSTSLPVISGRWRRDVGRASRSMIERSRKQLATSKRLLLKRNRATMKQRRPSFMPFQLLGRRTLLTPTGFIADGIGCSLPRWHILHCCLSTWVGSKSREKFSMC